MPDELQSEAKAEVISHDDFLCDSHTCETHSDGKFLDWDDGHLSYEGSEIVVRQFGLIEGCSRLRVKCCLLYRASSRR
jgi:hypothetical protein